MITKTRHRSRIQMTVSLSRIETNLFPIYVFFGNISFRRCSCRVPQWLRGEIKPKQILYCLILISWQWRLDLAQFLCCLSALWELKILLVELICRRVQLMWLHFLRRCGEKCWRVDGDEISFCFFSSSLIINFLS